MRILHLISQRPDSTGSGIYIQQLIEKSAMAGHSNRLVCGVAKGDIPHLAMINSADISCVEFGQGQLPANIVGMSDEMPYPSIRFRDLDHADIATYEFEFARALVAVIRKFRPHIIHSHHLWLLSSLASRLYPQIPMVTTCHGSDIRQFRTCSHLRARVLSGCRNIPAILALSEPQKSEIQSLYHVAPEKITVIGGGYSSELFFQKKKPSPSPVRLIYAGKLSYAKGVPYLLKALTTLEDMDFHLDLVGSGTGPEYEECMLLAGKLAGKISLHGSVPQTQLAQLMKENHIMILPSLYEGLPLTVLEAVASGCRVIATDLVGTREIHSYLPEADITLIPLPRGLEVDRIPPAEQPGFIRSLEESIRASVLRVPTKPDLDLAPLTAGINHFNWNSVYRRCEHVYNILLGQT